MQYRRQHTFEILVHLGVGHADDVKTESLEFASALLVTRAFRVRRMCAAVNLDNELPVERDEIDDLACDRMLAVEFPAAELPPSQRLPQNILGCSLISAQRTRARLEAVHPLTRLSR